MLLKLLARGLALLRERNVAQARTILAPAAFVAEGAGENNALKLIRTMNETQDPTALLAKAAELKLDRVNDFIEQPADKGKDHDKGNARGKAAG